MGGDRRARGLDTIMIAAGAIAAALLCGLLGVRAHAVGALARSGAYEAGLMPPQPRLRGREPVAGRRPERRSDVTSAAGLWACGLKHVASKRDSQLCPTALVRPVRRSVSRLCERDGGCTGAGRETL